MSSKKMQGPRCAENKRRNVDRKNQRQEVQNHVFFMDVPGFRFSHDSSVRLPAAGTLAATRMTSLSGLCDSLSSKRTGNQEKRTGLKTATTGTRGRGRC